MKSIKTQHDTIFILFGATGDLAQKKIIPALDSLFNREVFSKKSKVICVSRRDWDDVAFLEYVRKSINGEMGTGLSTVLSYLKIDIDKEIGYEDLVATIAKFKKEVPGAQIVIYLSLAPQYHLVVARALFKSGAAVRGRVKLLVEKPFGTNTATAHELNNVLTAHLDENDIYRIDHYLAKTAAKDMINQQNRKIDIKSIQARIFEEKGIDGRGESYNRVGAFSDVGQNHMLEMVALALAHVQDACNGDWQSARESILSRLVPPENTCIDFRRGQYKGYLAEKGVPSGSQTETAFKVVTMLDRIHITLESGKKMPSSDASLLVSYVDGSHKSFDFKKGTDAYETLISAALAGSRTEFVGFGEVLALWSYADRAHECWSKVPLEIYSDEKPFLVK